MNVLFIVHGQDAVEGEEDEEDEEEEEEEAGRTRVQDQDQQRTRRHPDRVRPATPMNASSVQMLPMSSGAPRAPELKSSIAPVLYPTCGAGKVRIVRQWTAQADGALARTAKV
jgi:casein kinase II subunit beta